MFNKFSVVIAASAVFITLVSAQNSSLVSLPYDLTYLLPNNFTGNLNSTFPNGTTTSNNTINSLLGKAKSSTFISYDDEFTSIFGANPQATLIADNSGSLQFWEAGVWVPERDEVWFASSLYNWPAPGYISAISLRNNTITNLTTLTHVNGGYYFNNQVYLGRYAPNSGIVAVNTTDLSTTPILNSYFGLPLNLVDDLVWVQQGNTKYLFFTVVDANAFLTGVDYPQMQLPDGVWRWDPQEEVLLPVISRGDIDTPNGVRVSPDQRTLYVTDSAMTAKTGAGAGGVGGITAGPYIYAYDIDERGMPANKRVFGLARDGIADGIHVDDKGRVWTGESEGVVVRSAAGKILGVVNSQMLGITLNNQKPLANFALAGDVLFIGAKDRLYRVDLAQTVVARDSVVVN